MLVESVYEFTEHADAKTQLALRKVGSIVEGMAYEGKISIVLEAIYPMYSNYLQNAESEITVDINTTAEEQNEIEATFETCLQRIFSEVSEPEPNHLYQCNDVFAFYSLVKHQFANEDSRIRFFVWMPGEYGEKFCTLLLRSAEDIWLSFIENTSLQ